MNGVNPNRESSLLFHLEHSLSLPQRDGHLASPSPKFMKLTQESATAQGYRGIERLRLFPSAEQVSSTTETTFHYFRAGVLVRPLLDESRQFVCPNRPTIDGHIWRNILDANAEPTSP